MKIKHIEREREKLKKAWVLTLSKPTLKDETISRFGSLSMNLESICEIPEVTTARIQSPLLAKYCSLLGCSQSGCRSNFDSRESRRYGISIVIIRTSGFPFGATFTAMVLFPSLFAASAAWVTNARRTTPPNRRFQRLKNIRTKQIRKWRQRNG